MTTTAQEVLRAGLAEMGCIYRTYGPCQHNNTSRKHGWHHDECFLAYLTSHRAEVLAALEMEQVGWEWPCIGGLTDDLEQKPPPCSRHGNEPRPLFAPKETTTPEQTEEGK